MRSVTEPTVRRETIRQLARSNPSTPFSPVRHNPTPVAAKPTLPPLALTGMFGIGDCIHQRAVLRELMKTHDVYLGSYYGAMFHDLVAQGLNLMAMSRTIGRIRDGNVPQWGRSAAAPPSAPRARVGYTPMTIKGHGSILAAQYASVGLTMPTEPDFSLPVPQAWRDKAKLYTSKWNTNKPILVYRPIILNKVWECPSRCPDPVSYAQLYQSIRDKFWVVSVAHLLPGREWIVGKEQDVDVKFHKGELDFETLCGLVSEATMVFGNPGFMPVMAQALGKPNIIVYGGNESYQTTNIVGAHLAPTLAIEPINSCPCHNRTHACDKRIEIEPALEKIGEFMAKWDHYDLYGDPQMREDAYARMENRPSRDMTLDDRQPGKTIVKEVMPSEPGRPLEDPRTDKTKPQLEPAILAAAVKTKTLIFGTIYIDTSERLKLTNQWLRIHRTKNPDCDLLLVDSCSPLLWAADGAPLDSQSELFDGVPLTRRADIWSFPDNIGHLSRNGPNGPKSKGQDGWGRAFCYGLQYAIDNGYDYVVHIEGDSLFKLPVVPIIQDMEACAWDVVSTPVTGTTRQEIGWVETGLMFFRTAFVQESGFIKKYNWPVRKAYPITPERVIFDQLGSSLHMAKWKAERADKSHITPENVHQLDWVTHCHKTYEVYDKFMEACSSMVEPVAHNGLDVGSTPAAPTTDEASATVTVLTGNPILPGEGEDTKPSLQPLVKLNFGCGTNKLDGWQNFDTEVNITRRLPFKDSYADFIFAEHCVEHITYYEALGFIRECRRVLKPGGVIRITVPSIEQVWERGDQSYFDFVKRWAPTADRRGAMDAIIHKHGHKTAWTESLMKYSLLYVGFEDVHSYESGQSVHIELKGVEGHHRIIGEKFNTIESVCCEGLA